MPYDLQIQPSDIAPGYEPMKNPSLQQMYQGNMQMTSQGPQFYQATGNPNAANFSGGGGGSNSDAFFNSANAPLRTGQVTSIRNNTASGGSVGGYNPAVLQNLVSQYGKASDKARLDSIAQHDALMSSVTGTMGKVDNYLATLGKSGENRIALNEANNKGAMQQSLISRGLGNTTVQDSALRGVSKDAELERQNLKDSLTQQKIGTTMGLENMYGDALLSRQNVAPGNEYLQLIQSLAGGR